ncbi:MAG TPA: sterol desaturase family protein [Tepidisphaeraceae bacterium]|nr:sterol desaturase family protein [Tepidisphaeraceae bacterium]
MDIAWQILTAGASFLLLFLMFRPLEIAFAAKANQGFCRPFWRMDLCYLLGEYMLFNGAVFWMLSQLSPWIYAATPSKLRNWVGSLDQWAQILLVILAGDFLIYWGHRLQHRFDFLWRFHCIHHSAEHLDWLAAHREHPVDSLYTILLVNLPVFALGVPIKPLAYFAAFRGLWAIFIHSNVRLPIGPLRMLIGAPELHHWHHDRNRSAGNYANVSPLMDILFGTYVCPDHEPLAVGVSESIPKTYFAQLIYPFRRRNVTEKESPSSTSIAS